MNQENKNELLITRTFNAPKKLVFDAMTKAEHLMHWWGPEGCTIEVIQLDARPGGIFHYCMKFPQGPSMYGVFRYREIQAPDKLVFTNSFADKDGNIVPAPMESAFPKEVLNTWIFVEQNGKTIVTFKGVPLFKDEAELKGFVDLNEGMNIGFSKTFDQLDRYLIGKFQLQQQLKKTTMARVSTYLNFPGNTEEVFTFYKSVFKTDFNGQGFQRFGDIPASTEHPPLSEADKKLILHVELPILGGHILMATDAPESMGFKVNSGNNMHINLEPDSREETTRLFNALSAEGHVSMPLEDMFWGAYYGSCTDKYGINWMFNYTEQK